MLHQRFVLLFFVLLLLLVTITTYDLLVATDGGGDTLKVKVIELEDPMILKATVLESSDPKLVGTTQSIVVGLGNKDFEVGEVITLTGCGRYNKHFSNLSCDKVEK